MSILLLVQLEEFRRGGWEIFPSWQFKNIYGRSVYFFGYFHINWIFFQNKQFSKVIRCHFSAWALLTELMSHTDLHVDIQSHFIHNGPKLERTQNAHPLAEQTADPHNRDKPQKHSRGLRWRCSRRESTCWCGGTGSIPGLGGFHMQRSTLAHVPQLLKPVGLEPVLKRSHHNGSLVHCNEEEPPPATTRESPRAATKIPHN